MKNSKYNDLIKKGVNERRNDNYKIALDYFQEAAYLDRYNSQAYISIGKTYYLDFKFDKSIIAHFLGVLLLSKLPHNPTEITIDYYDNARHIANAKIRDDESLFETVRTHLGVSSDEIDRCMDIYAHTLMAKEYQWIIKEYKEEIGPNVYENYELIMAKMGTFYMNHLLNESQYTKEQMIEDFIDQIDMWIDFYDNDDEDEGHY